MTSYPLPNPVLSDIHPYEPIEPYHRSYFTTKALFFRVTWVFHQSHVEIKKVTRETIQVTFAAIIQLAL